MHVQAYQFVASAITAYPEIVRGDVVEIGGRNINGSVRPLFLQARSYLSTDLAPGRGVELVVDAREPSSFAVNSVETIVCCEVLEHTPPEPILRNVASWLKPGGYLIATMATEGRAAHSGLDGGALRKDEYYENVTAAQIRRFLEPHLKPLLLIVNDRMHDLYLLAQKTPILSTPKRDIH